ncbi:phage tail sheath subtilisin-like domain-containing protein [Cohnella silvisoli]|uniref:Phage tail sheath subtilisin-like domain-containing protein n=1 Tax=Cohnella silvisoli TaxID=2873699 RepID=A0ABV1KYS7_9BACL|nr:phage tail sheath subtilisin-like domain-containing protein [Cohnella silvisoli]MCD9024315.1 phage tail sheath subtilisin-like domain-containing protein [Cohnella silvisoli]
MAGGSWDPTSLPNRPGLFINYIQAAAAQISGGARGTVAIPLLAYSGGTAVATTFYTVTTETEAVALFGSANVKSILFALQGGAKEVLVYTMPASPDAAAYTAMRNAFDTRPYNVFVLDGEYNTTQHAAIKTWVGANRTAGKHFVVVIGGDATTDATSTQGDTRSTLNSDDYIVNLINGVVIGGTSYTSSAFAPWVAGLIAGTAINRSITYTVAPVDDVTKRLTNAQIDTSLAAGSLLLIHDGVKVKVVQGIVTSKKKIRSIRARQAIATDVSRTAEDNYIGKLNNNADGQAALIVAILAYLESLGADGVLSAPTVTLDPQRPSVGDSVFLSISYTEVDSIERIFLSVNI